MNPQPKAKIVQDPQYKYWLIEEGVPLSRRFEIPAPKQYFWGGVVNHHLSCDKHRDDHQVRTLAGIHSWLHTARGIKWEKEHLKKLIQFAENEFSRYRKTYDRTRQRRDRNPDINGCGFPSLVGSYLERIGKDIKKNTF